VVPAVTSLLGPLVNRWMCKSYHASHEGETWQEQPRTDMSLHGLKNAGLIARVKKLVAAFERRK
jgi:hypothetical protein